MLALARASAGCLQSIALEMPEGRAGLTAYAFGNGGKVRSAVLVNRTMEALNVSTAALGLRDGTVLRLSGPAGDSTTGVTFGGAAVDVSGHWAATSEERLHGGSISLPSMSAAVVHAT